VALLSGLRNRRESIVFEQIYDRMKSLFPDQKDALTAGSILLANIYSSLGDNQRAEDIRSDRLRHIGKKVQPGITWTELNGQIVVCIYCCC